MELKKTASMHYGEEVKHIVKNIMNVDLNDDEIMPLESITNSNYKITVNGQSYVVRIPGVGTDKIIKRMHEESLQYITSNIGINAETIYFDPKTGIKICKFINNAETMTISTAKKPENVVLIAALFRKLHNIKEIVPFEFHFDSKLFKFERELLALGGTLYDDYEQVRKKILTIYSKNHVQPNVICHNDPAPQNFVKSGMDKVYLVDWEYGGMNDFMWDLTDFAIESEYTKEEADFLLRQYFKDGVGIDLRRRFVMSEIFVDFLWTVWGLLETKHQNELTEYSLERYQRAKMNLNILENSI